MDERLPGLFEPDTLLPIQYFEAMRKKHLLEGEKRLILSVLEDAIECFMKCIDAATNKGQRLFREADEWISLEDKRWVFSFDNVCDMLDINPDYMRVGLRKWKERKIEAMAQRRVAEAEAAAAAALAPAVVEPAPVAAAATPPAAKNGKVFAKPAMAQHRKRDHRSLSAHASSKSRRAHA
ncbi:MAG TPA: hypothetical protein VJX23_04105 [Candidatus Binataceae bacterium]|nr:hypothetical protein [Candidatus Binataceae bacterium]